MANYNDSVYKFTDPIRYFKENDPYYWEVDNIPLKQLQENVLWLKDQITPQDVVENIDTGVNRSDINELKPYSLEDGNLVYVKNGRYTARINDAYSLTPLQKVVALTNVASIESTGYNTKYFSEQTTTNDYAEFLLSSIQQQTTSGLNLNGLIETVNSWDYRIMSTESTVFSDGHPDINVTNVAWPTEELGQYLRNFGANVTRESQQLALEFVKQFRGVARTAVVDVFDLDPIEVPAFNPNDFYYKTTNNVIQLIPNATHRIDLLFIYSKPVDADITTINKWSANNPRQITKPVLGLVKGAGVGITKISTTSQTGSTTFLTPKSAEGHTQILNEDSDQLSDTNGFLGLNVHGSFPSPDDLMNLAPVIQEKLESTDPRLVGQSILPIAYIVVRKDAEQSQGGVPIITNTNIIDIRPFFRTTELAYNERAGIAAAIPSPSLANPVATKFNIEEIASRIKSFTEDTYQKKESVISGGVILAGGIVRGGKRYGPEQKVHVRRTGGDTSIPINTPDLPTWDLAHWVLNESNGFTVEKNYATNRYDAVETGVLEYVNFADGSNLAGFNWENSDGGWPNGTRFFFWLLRKKITITNVPQSIVDYNVKLMYHDCVPMCNLPSGKDGVDDYQYGTFNGLFVEKLPSTTAGTISFLIRVAVPLSVAGSFGRFSGGSNIRRPWFFGSENTLIQNRYNLFAVTTGAVSDLEQAARSTNAGDKYEPSIGFGTNRLTLKNMAACLYPSVSFDVIGYTSQNRYVDQALSENIDGNTVINLASIE